MPKTRVDLDEIIDGVDFQFDGSSSYLDRQTGHVVTVTDDEIRHAEEEDEERSSPGFGDDEEQIELARAILGDEADRFVALPDKHEIHEWRLMADFVPSIDKIRVAEDLDRALRGKGAFRYFKDTARRHGVLDQWYEYRQERFRQIAVDWCEAHHIEWFEEKKPPPKKE
jgi:hypothetical protein